MLGQHFHEKPSDHWINQEERDPGFNVLSPMGRHRPFKGIRLPRPAIPRHGSSIGQAYFGVNVPNNAEGVPYIYTKGPAGQTPFPTLVAMSSYFPPSQQEPESPTQEDHLGLRNVDSQSCPTNEAA